jgi:hypothetical protein
LPAQKENPELRQQDASLKLFFDGHNGYNSSSLSIHISLGSIMKHPVALAFLVAVVTTLALAGLALAVYTPQQAPWAIAMAVGTFPFVWFFAWLITNCVSWWRDTMAGPRSSEPTEERPEEK